MFKVAKSDREKNTNCFNAQQDRLEILFRGDALFDPRGRLGVEL